MNTPPHPIVAVVGSINYDSLVRVPALPVGGETVIARSQSRFHGGKGANQAVAAAQTLGSAGKVMLIGAVGGDPEGAVELAVLREAGVNTQHVDQLHEAETGVAYVIVDEKGANQIVVIPGANRQLLTSHVVTSLLAALPHVVLVSLEIPTEAAVAAVKMGRKLGAKVILNPAPLRPLPHEAFANVDLLTPNGVEFAGLVGASSPPCDRSALGALISESFGGSRTAQWLITLGRNGGVLISGSTSTHIPATTVDVIDTTGAGDVLNGTLAAAIALGSSIEDAAATAVHMASISTTHEGARCPLDWMEGWS